MQSDVRRFRERMENCRQQTAEGYKVTNPGDSSKEEQSKQGRRTGKTAEFRATTLLRNKAEWMSEVHAIIAFSTNHTSLKIVTKRR